MSDGNEFQRSDAATGNVQRPICATRHFNIHLIITKSSAVTVNPTDICACWQELPSGELPQFIGRIFWLLPTPLRSDTINKEDPIEQLGLYLVWENWYGWATIWWRSHNDDSVVWTHYINETDGQPCRHSKCRTNTLSHAAKISQKMPHVHHL